MTLEELIPLVARLFASTRRPYFVFGGIGVSLQGRTRTTHDLDVAVRQERHEVPALAADLRKLGFRIGRLEERKLREGRIVRLPLGRTQLDLKLCAPGHDLEALNRAQKAAFADFELWVASAEDLVLYKLQSWRTQDRADIENLLTYAKTLDRGYISKQIPLLEEASGMPLGERWKESLRSV